jgi:signal transduction histidine kinase
MGLGEYLREKMPFIIVSIVASAFAAFMLQIVRADRFFIFFVPGIFFAGILFALIPEYIAKYRYYREFEEILGGLDKRYLISEVAECPDFYEGRILYDALKLVGKSMNDEIAIYKRSSTEYREYIEMWVHEVKTPIAGLELICENKGNERALEEVQKIEGYVDQALFYSRSGDVEKDYMIKEIALSELVRHLLRNNSKYLISHKISVHLGNLAFSVRTDAKWVVFILRQLLDNSVKYGGKNLWFDAAHRDDGIVLIFRDDGIGIPEADVKRIFDKGFTGENGRRFGRSTGLGLYLCKKLCTKLGLSISADSRPGAGVTMEIVFPHSAWE